MAIKVGINTNVVIKSATINDKKRLVIGLDNMKEEGKSSSPFDQLLTAGVVNEGNNGMELSILGPLLPKKEEYTIEKKIELITGDLTRLKNQLTQILEQFMLTEKIDLNTLDVQFAGTGITDGVSFNARILDQDILDKIYENLAKRFVELITPFLNDATQPLRFKLVRQSKDKHYATIPSRFIADQPFVDLMAIPDDQTRVKFTKYELEQGLDNGTPIAAADKAEAKGESTTAPIEANPFAAQ